MDTQLDGNRPSYQRPVMLIVLGSGSLSLFTHRFETAVADVDPNLISGLLGAITSLARNICTQGTVCRIDQHSHVLLVVPLGEDTNLVLVVREDTVEMRQKLNQLSHELSNMEIVDYLEANVFLTNFDVQKHRLTRLVKSVFQ